MTFEEILFERRDGVAHLTLHRPDAMNGITQRMSEELLAAVTAIADDPSVRAVVLSGAGGRFCGGGDVKGFGALGDGLAHHLREITVPLHAAVSQLARIDAPVIAAVQGSAAGAGIGLVLGADLVVAGESAKFVLAYTGIGLTPDGSTSWSLPRVVGLHRALDLALTNRVLSAAEAAEWGIVTRVVPDADVLTDATALAEQIAGGPTQAFGAVKRLIRGAFDHSLEEHLVLETESMVAAGRSADGLEGVAAFVEKRPPVFRGR